MLSAKNLTKFYNDVPVVNHIDFDIHSGDMIGLVGPSGGGKSVLLKLISGVIEPDLGSIEFHDDNATSVGVLFQEGALFDSMSVLDNVAFPLFEKGVKGETLSRNDVYDRAYDVLNEVGLRKAYKKHPGQLSGGMRRRVGIARALVAKPKLVLLDDPTGGLDPVAASVILELVNEISETHGLTVVSISHDIRRLLPNVERLWVMVEGRLIYDMPPEQIASSAPRAAIDFISSRYDL